MYRPEASFEEVISENFPKVKETKRTDVRNTMKSKQDNKKIQYIIVKLMEKKRYIFFKGILRSLRVDISTKNLEA